MKREDNFADATRAKFYRKRTELRPAIYRDPNLDRKLKRLSQKQGYDFSDLVNH